MNNIIDGRRIALELKAELLNKVEKLERKPFLVVISAGDNEASKVYINAKGKAAKEVGIRFEHVHFHETTEDELLKTIDNLNEMDNVDGVIVQLPLPEGIDKEVILNRVAPSKDVDGLTYHNFNNLVNGKKTLIPCTPLGVMKLLDIYNVNTEYANVVVVGRSNLVGAPLFHLLNQRDATVTLCHAKTKDLSIYTKTADIVITAAGSPGLITGDMIKKDSVLIDIGITKVDGKLKGDMDFDSCKDKAKLITPVPGGVGPMTVAMLLYNTYHAYKVKRD